MIKRVFIWHFSISGVADSWSAQVGGVDSRLLLDPSIQLHSFGCHYPYLTWIKGVLPIQTSNLRSGMLVENHSQERKTMFEKFKRSTMPWPYVNFTIWMAGNFRANRLWKLAREYGFFFRIMGLTGRQFWLLFANASLSHLFMEFRGSTKIFGWCWKLIVSGFFGTGGFAGTLWARF